MCSSVDTTKGVWGVRIMGKRHKLLLHLVRVILDGQTITLYCTSPEDADRWRVDVEALLPTDVIGDLLTFTWPGHDTTPA